MYSIYKKSEISFALFWIAVYCVVMTPVRGRFGDESIYMLLALVAIGAGISIFVKRHNLTEKYGLIGFPENSKQYLYFIPIWFLSTGNLWGGFNLAYTGLNQVWATLSMLLIGYVEEMIFRGFLLRALLPRDGARKSIVIVAVTFGIGHIVNMLAGQATVETMAQVIFAIAWGFMLTIIVYKSGSLLPCILAHSLVNATSKYGFEAPGSEWTYIIATIIIAALYCPYLLKIKGVESAPSSNLPK